MCRNERFGNARIPGLDNADIHTESLNGTEEPKRAGGFPFESYRVLNGAYSADNMPRGQSADCASDSRKDTHPNILDCCSALI